MLVELLADRAVALPPVSAKLAADMAAGLRVSKAAGRDQGARLDDLDTVAWAIAGVPELGKHIEALDVNPLICGPDGAVAVGALAVPHRTTPPVS